MVSLHGTAKTHKRQVSKGYPMQAPCAQPLKLRGWQRSQRCSIRLHHAHIDVMGTPRKSTPRPHTISNKSLSCQRDPIGFIATSTLALCPLALCPLWPCVHCGATDDGVATPTTSTTIAQWL